METYIRLIAVLIVGCRGINVLKKGKPVRFNSQSCTFFLKKVNLIIREGFERLHEALLFRAIRTFWCDMKCN